MFEQITVSHPPGEFIYIVKDKDGNALFVGGTCNLDKKAFSFPFEYDSIVGYYYPFPDFADAIDAKICELNPRHNARLHSYRTEAQAANDIRAAFRKFKLPFRKQEKELMKGYLEGCERIPFRGDFYFSNLDIRVTIDSMLQEYGKNYFKP